MTGTAVVPKTFGEQTEAVQMILDLEASGLVTLTSLQLSNPELEFERYDMLGAWLGWVKRWTSWAIGDWLNFGEGVYGEDWSQALASTQLSQDTLQLYQFVCRQVPESRRYPDLAFGCHHAVARLDPKEQTQWLRKASKKGWSEKDLRNAMKALRAETHPTLLPDDQGEGADTALVMEAAKAIVRDATSFVDGQHYLVPNEDIARLKSALGQDGT